MTAEPTNGKKYRVIQWGIGNVGTLALRHMAHNPVFEIVGVLCNRPEKVGRDAGELVGVAPIGIKATTDKDALEALDADCVFYAPLWSDVDEICRLLRGGKCVVASGGAWWHRTETNGADIDKIEAACAEGRTSFHGGGIHPGYAADLLVLTLARIVGKTDHIHIYEAVNFNRDTLKYLDEMGFGKTPEEFAKGNLFADAWSLFAQSMTMVVEGLGKTVEKFTTDVELGVATRDISVRGLRGHGHARPQGRDQDGDRRLAASPVDGVGGRQAVHHPARAVLVHRTRRHRAQARLGALLPLPHCHRGRPGYRIDSARRTSLLATPPSPGTSAMRGRRWSR